MAERATKSLSAPSSPNPIKRMAESVEALLQIAFADGGLGRNPHNT